MRAKLFFCLCFFVVSTLHLHAQTTTAGRVVDEHQQPVSYANVVLLSLPDSTFVQGMVTDHDGRFRFENVIPSDDKLVQISYIGYETVSRRCTEVDMNAIVLVADAIMLGEAVVTASRVVHQLKNGNLVTDVANSPLSKEHNAVDILKKIPGMMMNKGNLEVFGAGAPIIYVNGRKVTNNEELLMLDPKNIKDVELITNPGSKYDAEGKAVLNIRTLVRDDGWGAKIYITARQGRRFSDNETANFVFKKKGFTLAGTYGFTDMRIKSEQIFSNKLLDDNNLTWNYDELIKGRSDIKQHTYQLSVDYSLNENHSFGIRYDGNANTLKNNSTDENVAFRESEHYTTVNSISYYDNAGHVHHGNAFYYGQLSKQLRLELNLDYVDKNSDQNQQINEVSETESRYVGINTLTESNLYSGRLDLTYDFNRGGKLSIGSEFSKVDVDGRLDNREEVVENSKFNNREEKWAGYAMYEVALNKLNLNAGLRYENVQSDMNNLLDTSKNISKTYADWFPSLSLSTSLGKAKTSLSYAIRTTRPAFDILNSKVYYSNRFMQQFGNPQIKPQQSHNIQASFNYRFLNIRLGYSYMKDYIGSVLTSQDNILISSWKNYDKAQELSAYISASKTYGFWNVTLATGMVAPFITLDYKGEDYKNNTPKVYVQLNNYFTLTDDFGIMLDFMYTNGGSSAIWKFKPIHSLDLGVRKSLWKKRVDINIQANDLLQGLIYKYDSRINNVTFYQREDQDRRTVSVSIVYRFNNLKSKYRGKGSANDELRRL